MALVSPSLSPNSGLNYGATPPAFSRSSSDPPPAQIRALPTLPTGAARRQGSQQSLGGTSPATQAARPLPSPAAGRSPSAPPFVELSSSRSVSPLPPASTTRTTIPSRSTSTPSPSPYQHHQHTLSASSSASSSAGSLPRLPPVHLVAGPNSAPPVPNGLVGVQQYPQHHQQQHHQHPSFIGHHPSFPSFGGGAPPAAGPHAFPHPQYPFIPSPHPHAGGPGAALGYQPGPYSPGFNAPGATGSPAANAESQHQARLVQQAHLQQQQWQMEMMRNQQQGQAFDWQQQQQGQARRRATSGPNPASHSPTYYTSPLPYPPSPSPTLHTKYLPNVGTPALPPGAMLPQFGHGYPTPPGSVEGRENSREGYHPYRRGGAKADNDRSTSHPRPPTSSAMTHNPSGSSSSSQHHRNESASSALAAHNFPPLPGKPSPVASTSSSSSAFTGASSSSTKHGNSSTTSVGSSTGRTSSSARSTPPPPATVPLPPVSRSRTESQQSTTTSSSSSRDTHSRQYSSSSGSSSRRGESFDSARSATPVQGLNSKKPSPLSRQYQQAASVASHGSSSRPSSELERPGTPGTLRAGREEEDDAEDSDDTAGATIAPNSAGALKGIAGAGVQGKEKDKKGMKSRFKKAFGGSSTPALSEGELDGRGPKLVERQRVDSSSSTDSGALGGRPRLLSSSASVMAPSSSAASTSGSTRPPPSTSGRRFGMLNGKFNGSSDNLSISSTVSSASVMIRKLGNMGKLARRNSLMSLTKAFKSNKDKDEDPSAPTKEELKQLKKENKKKGSLASASVSHATAEVESPSRVHGMSPAAALAKKHQQQYAEQEAAAAAAEAAAEAERQRNGRSFTAHARGESDAASVKSGKMLDGKKGEKEKKSKGRKWGFGGSKKEGGATGDDSSSIADGSSIREGAGGYSRSTSAAGYYEDEGLAPGVEVLAQPAYAAYGASYQEGEAAAAESEYEPSVVENTHRREYKGVRGILKGAGSYRQEDYALPKPAFPRTRAASFDAPQQQARPGSPGNAALVNVIPSEAQVDGLVPSATSPRNDTQPPSPNTTPLDRVPPPPSANPAAAASSSGASPYSHPSMNVSAPTLSQFGNKLHPIRSASAPGGSGRRIAFAQNLSVHTTWPANVYDRRAEPATCNRLTPTLAQQIKEELNSFKMEEMDVHPSSRQLTHFFV